MPTTRNARAWRGLGIAAVVAAAGAATAAAQSGTCAAQGSRETICSLDLYAAPKGERLQKIDVAKPLVLAPGQEMVVELDPRDQRGLRFPEQRLAYGHETSPDCRGLVEVEESALGRYRLQAATAGGRCTLMLWVPGNMNLEWRLALEVAKPDLDTVAKSESERIIESLFAGILGREPGAETLAERSRAVERGELAMQIRQIVGSSEFRSRMEKQTPAQLLEQLYQGLLGRAPDAFGRSNFLPRLERGDYAGVVWDLTRSEEFQRRMLAGGDR